ncbi:MAG TPA: amidohydrolase family protein [Chitinophagaceae bacterium]|nr:amidohydrolase family protein [Chitinophagaceae bacterium]
MRLIITIPCFFILSLPATAQKFDTIYHPIVTNGYISGMQKSWKESKNEYHFIYYDNDRGRGVNVKEIVTTTDDGKIIAVTTEGVDYFKAPYSASFSIVGDSAVWTLNGVRKSQPYNNEIYTSTIAPGVRELWIHWLLKQPDKKAPELPDDSIRVTEPVVHKIPYLNKVVTLKFFSRPNGYTWMTDDLRFFATVGRISGTILQGFEALTDTLFAIQESLNTNNNVEELNTLSSRLNQHLLIKNVTLFVSSKAKVRENMSVEITEGKIVSIFPANTRSVRADTTIDAKGKFLMPGLWDMHSHYQKGDGIWYLAGGVTHVRDMNTTSWRLLYQKQINADELLGPAISYTSGLIDKRDPLQVPEGKIVSTLEEAISAIDYFKKSGYNQIKLYSSLKPEWVKPMIAHAHSSGMRVSGHVPAYMSAEQAINWGYNEINHSNQVFMNFMGPDTLASNGFARVIVPALLSGTIDLDSKKVRSFIKLMKKKNVAHEPTLRIQEGMYTEFKGDTSKMHKPIINWMSEFSRSSIVKTSGIPTEEQKPAFLASFQNCMKMVKLMYEKGILLVAGTDGGQAIALHREMEIYAEAGIPANEVLKIATYNAAKDCDLQNEAGEIRVGRIADLILIDGNPSKNISDIRRVEWVIKNGRMYSPKQLYASREWKYYY